MPTQTLVFDPAAHELITVWPDQANALPGRFGPNLTIPKGTGIAMKASDGKFYPYNTSGSGGLEVCRGLLKRSIVTDANGRIAFGDQNPGEHGATKATAEIYYRGTFKRSDLAANVDADAIAQMGARFLTGGPTPAEDLLYIP